MRQSARVFGREFLFRLVPGRAEALFLERLFSNVERRMERRLKAPLAPRSISARTLVLSAGAVGGPAQPSRI